MEPPIPDPDPEFEGDADFVPVRIESVSITNLGFIVFLKREGDDRVVPIFIGANEAQSIALALNNQPPPRPMTHDLLKTMLGSLDCEVSKVQVTDLVENTFHGRVFISRAGVESLDFDARPSDAIALAIRFGAPIFIRDSVFEAAAVAVTEEEGQDGEEPPNEGPRPSPLEILESRLKKALEAERYEEAARLRDEIKRLQSEN